MSDVSLSVASPPAAPPPASPVAVPAGPISSRDAAGLLGQLRAPSPTEENRRILRPPAEAAPAAPAETNSEPVREAEPEDNASPAQERPADEEDQPSTDPEPAPAAPSIEPPRSWSAEDKEIFKTLPPETQARLAERDRARESEFRRGQNEQAEAAKAAVAKSQEYEQKRAEYERALPALMSMLAEQQAGEFADVKSWEDVQKLAQEDLPRYLRWEVHNKRMAAVKSEMETANARQAQENTQKFTTWAVEQDGKFAEKAPEFADAKTAAKARSDVVSYLKDVGFTDDEVNGSYTGKHGLSLRDHRAQLVIRDAARWRSAEAARKAAEVRKPPPVQRPGVTQSKGEGRAEALATAHAKLERSGSAKDAVAVLRASRRAS